jgi:hypothetical protein
MRAAATHLWIAESQRQTRPTCGPTLELSSVDSRWRLYEPGEGRLRFFITLAAALNFGFFVGEIDNPTVHNGVELAAALVASLVATVLKFGDRTQLGAIHLATSLVADLQLWSPPPSGLGQPDVGEGMSGAHMSVVVSLSGGALLANIVSVVLMVSEIIQVRR